MYSVKISFVSKSLIMLDYIWWDNRKIYVMICAPSSWGFLSDKSTESIFCSNIWFLGFFFKRLFIFERETECKQRKDREREREMQNLKQAPGSGLSAQSRCRAWTPRPWDHDLSQSWTLNQLSHPGTSGIFHFWYVISVGFVSFCSVKAVSVSFII